MSLAQRAADGPKGLVIRATCSVGNLLARLDQDSPDEAAALCRMLADQSWPHIGPGSVYEALEAEGYDVSQHQIGKHRRRQCCCP